MALLFGPAGSPISSPAPSTAAGIGRVAELGLGCLEVEFVQRVGMGAQTAAAVGRIAAAKGIRLSAHGPYAVNLNAKEAEKVLASRQRVLQTARIAGLLGAEDVVFHAAFYLGDPPSEVYERVKGHIKEMVAQLRAEGNQVRLCPEVMGKPDTQFGSLEELLRLASEVPGVAPCVDFAHLHARSGANNSYREFVDILEQVEKALGPKALKEMQMHVSGIEYGHRGERKHLVLKESDLHYQDLLRAFKDKGVEGAVVCESPNLEEDALLLQETYHSL
ncbi:MAG: TIM barrel protein [Chloroflexota bacterium]|nr:TIM barrel protein [Chloroflexota bacterium]